MWQLKNSNFDNSKTQILTTQKVTKLKSSNCDKTQNVKLWQNQNYKKSSKTQIVTKLENWNCDKIQKLKLWQNSKTHCDKIQDSTYEKIQKTKIVRKLKTQIVTKLFCLLQMLSHIKKNYISVKTIWHIDNQGMCSGQLFAILPMFFSML